MNKAAGMSFPSEIGEVTVGWLGECLRERGVPGAERLRSFDAEPVARQGMTSLAHVLTLDYEGEGGVAPRTMLAKFSLDSKPVKEAFAANRGFEREVAFYNSFGANAGIPVPRCYWARYDAEANRCGMLLEYVENTRATDVFTGRVEEIEPVVAHLASFHAKWWNRPELKGVYPGQAPFMLDLILEKLTLSLDSIKSHYRSEVGDTLIDLLELWIPNAHRFADHERSKPQTLCHGDLHREQILFPLADGDPLCVIDWQLVASDSGATDLAHLLVSGLRPEQRERKERELVERYHAGLLKHGVADYSLDDVWASYRQGVARLALFYMTAFAMGDITPVVAWWESDAKRKEFSFWEATCGWTSRALEDHRVLDHLRRLV